METEKDPRIERLKEVLSSSYPRVEKGSDPVPLPASVITRLHPEGQQKVKILSKMKVLFSRPAMMVGATAVLMTCAVFLLKTDPAPVDQGGGIRSGGETATTPQLILIDPSAETLARFKASGYFPDTLLTAATSYSPDGDPAIVLNWKDRTVTSFVPGEEPRSEAMAQDDGDVLEQVLTLYQEASSE